MDILKFSNGFLGRYDLSRLINLNCQSRLGITMESCSVLNNFVRVYSYCQTLPSKVCCYSWSFLDFCCEFISETIDLVYLGMQVVPKYALFTHNIVVQDGAPNAFVVVKIVMRLKS
jgi:hypothetical protein